MRYTDGQCQLLYKKEGRHRDKWNIVEISIVDVLVLVLDIAIP